MAVGLRTPFGVDWDDLTLESLLAFLQERPDESLTWEAKGGDIRPEHVRKSASAFGNSDLGGVLVLGTTQTRPTKEWVLDGWQPPETEVELWVGHCLGNGGVDPRPSTATKAWELPGGGSVACVAIRPVAIPPVITGSGQVWERTSSESVRVKDPVALRRLFDRGKAAEDRIYSLSNSAAIDLAAVPPDGRPQLVVVAMAAASLPADVSAQVFRRSFYDGLLNRLREGLRPDMPIAFKGFAKSGAEVNQGSLAVWNNDGFHAGEGFTIRVGRHGSVAVGFADAEVASGAEWASGSADRIQRAWSEAAAILVDLGAVGRTHVVVRFGDEKRGPVSTARWSEAGPPSTEDIEAVIRDVKRALGQAAWEPE